MPLGGGPFTPDDFAELSAQVIAAWTAGLDHDWSAPAGALEWSCFTTADHTIDCVFSYALFLAARRDDVYPPFTELHALPGASPRDLVNGLSAVCTMLSAVVAAAPADARAIIFGAGPTGIPQDFAARGGLELILHAHDVCRGLGVSFDPPRDLCARLRDHTHDWPGVRDTPVTDDPWSDVLARSGRQPG
ncbi:MAG TPA: maleylpyruvate isomerase N-terminal domain-containing protein [Acidimicrobiia bacterium]|nr:maleylpyruvate isomerase N-terminal domain-containing protein [Acidimicrobiia bacterium]